MFSSPNASPPQPVKAKRHTINSQNNDIESKYELLPGSARYEVVPLSPYIGTGTNNGSSLKHSEDISSNDMSEEKEQMKNGSSNLPDAAPPSTQAFWLIIWMANNILVTLLNKAAFAKVDFKYPYALSTVHMACNIIGAQIYFLSVKTVKPKQIEGSSYWNVILFSFIFSLNIAIGNTSLRWVSVNFNQVSRALVPVIVMGVSMIYYRKSYSLDRRTAVIPICFGVALAFYGDMSYTTIGAFYTLLCVVLAALKAIMGSELLTGDLKLHEIDLLSKMCPLALVEIGIMSFLTGEVAEISSRWTEICMGPAPQVILLSGLLSFSLNVSSFIANKVTSPLTLAISANVKQVLLVAFGTLYFGDTVTFVNGLGILIVIIGSFRYGVVTVSEKA